MAAAGAATWGHGCLLSSSYPHAHTSRSVEETLSALYWVKDRSPRGVSGPWPRGTQGQKAAHSSCRLCPGPGSGLEQPHAGGHSASPRPSHCPPGPAAAVTAGGDLACTEHRAGCWSRLLSLSCLKSAADLLCDISPWPWSLLWSQPRNKRAQPNGGTHPVYR